MLCDMEYKTRKDSQILSECIKRMEDGQIKEGVNPLKAKEDATKYFGKIYENGNMEYIREDYRKWHK